MKLKTDVPMPIPPISASSPRCPTMAISTMPSSGIVMFDTIFGMARESILRFMEAKVSHFRHSSTGAQRPIEKHAFGCRAPARNGRPDRKRAIPIGLRREARWIVRAAKTRPNHAGTDRSARASLARIHGGSERYNEARSYILCNGFRVSGFSA